MIDMLVTTGELLGGLCAVLALAMGCRRTRRVAFSVIRYGKLHMSPWMLALFGACLMIPGPLDELVVLPVMVALTLRTARNRAIFTRYIRTAWNG